MIIGLIGKAGSGKTTVAQYLVDVRDFRRVGFADEIKRILQSIGLFSNEELWRNKTPASRQAMQEFGEWVRKYDYLYWTDKCYQTIRDLRARGALHIVVDDVRRLDEAEMIQRLKGKLVRVYRDSLDNITDYSHISETEMDEITPDFVLRNNHTIVDLQMSVLKLYNELKDGGC